MAAWLLCQLLACVLHFLFQVAAHVPPGEIVSTPAIHNAIGIQDELDMDIFGEFFVT